MIKDKRIDSLRELNLENEKLYSEVSKQNKIYAAQITFFKKQEDILNKKIEEKEQENQDLSYKNGLI